MLASLRDAIYISVDRWYLPLRGINHRLIADKPPACPIDMTIESSAELSKHNRKDPATLGSDAHAQGMGGFTRIPGEDDESMMRPSLGVDRELCGS